jgi:general secretion pathway protein A
MSYLEHFNLSEQPFRLTPDPEFVYWSKQHARAKAYMESTIWLADGFVVITGEIGSGKTTLLQAFLSELDDDVVYAVVSQTQLTPSQFLQAVLAEFGFDPFKKRKVELLDMLNMFLIEQYSNGKKVVLIVDEAQNLSKKVLEEIRMLSGIETHKEKVLRIILAGQPELREKLESPRLKQLLQRVRLRFHIGPLDPREMREYIEHRLEIAGHSAHDLFADDCFERIHLYTGGVPRLINTLCDTALLCAFAEQKTVLEAADIIAAVDELGWQEATADDENSANLPHLVPSGRAAPRCKIQVRADGRILAEHILKPGRVVIGRAPDNEIYIKSKFVSRHHAQIICDENDCIIEDLNSTNGVFVGNRRVKKHALADGDVVSLGIHDLIFSEIRHSPAIADDDFTDSDEDEDSGEEDYDDEDRAANDS